MSAHIQTIHHVTCFECGLDELHRWQDEARDAMDAHNQTVHPQAD